MDVGEVPVGDDDYANWNARTSDRGLTALHFRVAHNVRYGRWMVRGHRGAPPWYAYPDHYGRYGMQCASTSAILFSRGTACAPSARQLSGGWRRPTLCRSPG